MFNVLPLNMSLISSSSKESTDLRCPNCLYYFSQITKPYYLPCSHNLCLDCIHSLSSSTNQQRPLCPICYTPFPKGADSSFQINIAFLTLVSNILKTKIIFCAKCNKIFPWNEHSSRCDQSKFKEVNEIINDIKKVYDKSVSILMHCSYHYDIIQISKENVYRIVNESIRKINDTYQKKYSNEINYLLNDVTDVNFAFAKKEICKFLELCKPSASILNINETELSNVMNSVQVHKCIANLNDDTEMKYKFKGNQVNQYQINFHLKRDLKTSRSPFPIRNHNKYDVDIDDDIENGDIPDEKEIGKGEGMLKINNFNNPKINEFQFNSFNTIQTSKRNNDIYDTVFNNNNDNNLNRKIDLTDIIDGLEDIVSNDDNKKKLNKLVINNKGVTKVIVDNHNTSRNKYNCDINNVVSVNKNYNTLEVKNTLNSMSPPKKQSNPLIMLNKVNKVFNKIKDLLSKINSHIFHINLYSSQILYQIENNNSTISNQLTSNYSSLLTELSYYQTQTHKRYLITFIPNTGLFHLYDVKHKSLSCKNFSNVLLNNSLDISVSITFDDSDLVFISGGKYTLNHFQVIRWSNSKCELNTKLSIKRSYHTSLYYNNHLYLIGGIGCNSLTKERFHLRECESYSLSKQSWDTMPLLNYPRANASVCVVNNKYLYVFSGSNCDKMLDSIEYLNIQAYDKGWNAFVPDDPGLCWFGCEYSCVVSYQENKVIIFGGRDAQAPKGYAHCFELDIERRVVYRMKDIPTPAWFKDASGTFCQGEVSAIKWEGDDIEKRVYVYNIRTNKWLME